ncbi:MAG: DUF2752 domain-containing protein [Deltaproteobacteria bacterium]|nr:DUF2752 domain-containing protein [Deltaproteobacteria bacterium]
MEWHLCALRFFWGIPCPGCGLAHSLWALLKGDVAQSIAWHPMGVLIALWVLNFWWWRRLRLSPQAQKWIGYAVLGGFFIPWFFQLVTHDS